MAVTQGVVSGGELEGSAVVNCVNSEANVACRVDVRQLCRTGGSAAKPACAERLRC